jgi:rhodanese-related sulfurtransferase
VPALRKGSEPMTATLILAASLMAAQTPPVVDPPRITQRDFKKLVAAKQVVVIDTRYPGAFRAGHIPGAILVPLDGASWPSEFDRAVGALKTATKPVIVYCACAGDSAAVHAAILLSQHGVRDVRVLVGGWIDWFNDGNPVAKGEK